MRASLVAVALLVALAVIGCGGNDVDINPSGPRAQVQWGEPPGKEEPKGVVMLLPGGGWQPNPRAYEGEMPTAAILQQQGYATVVVGYDTGAEGFQEIKQVYAKAQKRYPDLPICIHGISAGGNLGLLLAAKEPDLTCVLAIATPTNLPALKQQGSDEVYDLAVDAFGEDQLPKWSPVTVADRIKAKVLLINGETDPFVPIAQSHEFTKARPETELDVVSPGSTPVVWLHGAESSPDAAQAAAQRGLDFINESLNGG